MAVTVIDWPEKLQWTTTVLVPSEAGGAVEIYLV
jgi:hypothetical protein